MCSTDDIQMLLDQTEFWHIDEQGEASSYADITTDGDFRGYVCYGEDHDEIYFDNFDEVKEHINGN